MPTAPLPHTDTTASRLLFPDASPAVLSLRAPVRRRPFFAFLPFAFLSTHSLLTETPPWGFFSGMPKTEPVGEGRRLRLLEDFSYTDPSGRTWLAPAASIVDGLSLPGIFRSVLGSTWQGKWRNAAIIHAAACEQKNAAWPHVHLTLYFALRSSGVSEIKAKIIYYAVHHFGPRWGIATALAEIFSAVGLSHENMRPFVDEQDATEIIAWIERANPSVPELQATLPGSPKIKTAPAA